MKKPTLIIGKKHIILACLTLVLGIAVYLHYAFAQSGEQLKTTSLLTNSEGAQDAANYGDAEFVNGEDISSDDYFAQARLDKNLKRDEAVETLQAMIGGGDLSSEELAVAKLDAVTVSKLVESEGVIESLIKAQGFEDCVVYLEKDTANIVVKTQGLVPSEAAQIKDILLSQVSVPKENITIFEVK